MGTGSVRAQSPRVTEPPRLTLKQAIVQALDHNKSIKVEEFTRSIARAGLLEARGRFEPALTFERTTTQDQEAAFGSPSALQRERTDDYRLALEGLTPWGLTYRFGGSTQRQHMAFNRVAGDYTTFGGVSLVQPLLRGFGFGSNLYRVRVARADRSISEWVFRQTVMTTVTRVVIGYSDLMLAHENLQIARRTRDLVAGLAASNARRFKAGSLSESDVVQARAQAAQREEAILVAERAVRDADNALRQLLGESTFTLGGPLLDIEPPAPSGPIVTGADEVAAALERRPDFQGARLDGTKQQATVSYQRNQLLPQLDLVGSYGYTGRDQEFSASRSQVAERDNRAYSVGVVVRVPLTFAEGRGRVQAARFRARQAEMDTERLAQEIALSITRAAGQIDTAILRVSATEAAYELASQALAGELKKLQAGTTSTFVVLNLQTTLATVEINRARAKADHRKAIALYEEELGVTLSRHNIDLLTYPAPLSAR
jgi:outer membrane protein TolC